MAVALFWWWMMLSLWIRFVTAIGGGSGWSLSIITRECLNKKIWKMFIKKCRILFVSGCGFLCLVSSNFDKHNLLCLFTLFEFMRVRMRVLCVFSSYGRLRMQVKIFQFHENSYSWNSSEFFRTCKYIKATFIHYDGYLRLH